MTLVAQHLPGKENVTADEESRVMKDRSDWMLNPGIFKKIPGPTGGGPFCITADDPATPVLQLASGPPKQRRPMPSYRIEGAFGVMPTPLGVW